MSVSTVTAEKRQKLSSDRLMCNNSTGAEDIGYWSEDVEPSSSEHEEQGSGDPEAKLIERKAALGTEFTTVFRKWRSFSKKIEWHTEFPNNKVPESKPDLVKDLMMLPIGKLYNRLLDEESVKAPGAKRYGLHTYLQHTLNLPHPPPTALRDPLQFRYGFLPEMARGWVGKLNSESYSERCISIANDVVTDGNTMLGSEEIEMVCVLRMNREFMKYMREHFNKISNQRHGLSLATMIDVHEAVMKKNPK